MAGRENTLKTSYSRLGRHDDRWPEAAFLKGLGLGIVPARQRWFCKGLARTAPGEALSPSAFHPLDQGQDVLPQDPVIVAPFQDGEASPLVSGRRFPDHFSHLPVIAGLQ